MTNGHHVATEQKTWEERSSTAAAEHQGVGGLSSSQLFTAARDLLATQYLNFNNTHNHINNNLGMMRQAGYNNYNPQDNNQFPGTAMLAEMNNTNNVNNNVSCWSELSHLKPGLQACCNETRVEKKIFKTIRIRNSPINYPKPNLPPHCN